MSKKQANYKGEVYLQANGEFGWRIVAPNGRIMASGEGHTRARDARRALSRLLTIVPRVRIVHLPPR